MSFRTDDRAVSIAVTHVLAIGITTILIGGLILGASGLLQGEQDRAADRELQAIGENMANEIVTATATAQERNLSSTEVRTNHPLSVTGQSYRVELEEDQSDLGGACTVQDRLDQGVYDACLVLTADTVEREVPLKLPDNVEPDGGSASGENIVIEYDEGEVFIRGG